MRILRFTLICCLLSSIAAGLTMAYLSQDQTKLKMLEMNGPRGGRPSRPVSSPVKLTWAGTSLARMKVSLYDERLGDMRQLNEQSSTLSVALSDKSSVAEADALPSCLPQKRQKR